MTYITKHVDKRVVGAVRHCQPVTAEKDDVDVGIPEQSTVNSEHIMSTQHYTSIFIFTKRGKLSDGEIYV